MAILLTMGRRLEFALRFERIGIPIALLVGAIALFLGPYGKLHLLPESVTDIWVQLPSPLLTLVFATLMIGRPIPNISGILQPVASQSLLALVLGFGQYLVGGLVVLMFLIPKYGVDPLMGCLIEIGFEGGHGAAAIMGDSLLRLGFPEGLDLGLAMATVGLLSSTLIGSLLVILARWRGWLIIDENDESKVLVTDQESNDFFYQVKEILTNLALAGFAVLFGVLSLILIKSLAPYSNGIVNDVLKAFPVFPLALLGSLIVRLILEKTEKTTLVSTLIQREVGTVSTDLLIITAMASLNLPLLLNDWLPITVLSITGLIWNLAGMFFFAKLTFKKEWFERSIAEFGNATGVAASGILLLRLSDPKNSTNTLPIFSIKQLLLQPLLSGGIITVTAPLAVRQFGLKGWTELSGLLTIIFISFIFILSAQSLNNDSPS